MRCDDVDTNGGKFTSDEMKTMLRGCSALLGWSPATMTVEGALGCPEECWPSLLPSWPSATARRGRLQGLMDLLVLVLG